jgi:O-antigen ligase
MVQALVVLSVACLLGASLRFPRSAVVLWILVLETSPDQWLGNLTGAREAIIGVTKAYGLALAALLMLRFGARRDRYNPSFAFALMFLTGLVHGLYPGLSLLSSLRSLIGSAAPFAFGFVRMPENFSQAVRRAAMWGPLFTVAFGGLLAISGLAHMVDFEQGALRLGASGEPPFLAGFALIGVYAGLLEWQRTAGRQEALLVLANFLILLLLTGARVPLALALLVGILLLVRQRRLMLLAGGGAIAALGAMFFDNLSFLRVVDLVQLGEAASLSNRGLIWPYFQSAFAASPLFGWGVGAGKNVVPLSSYLPAVLGTNAAHDEFLRIGTEGGVFGLCLLIALIFLWARRGTAALAPDQRWLMRLVFLAFACQSATDNTLIATTSSVFFLWVSAVFASAAETPTSPP